MLGHWRCELFRDGLSWELLGIPSSEDDWIQPWKLGERAANVFVVGKEGAMFGGVMIVLFGGDRLRLGVVDCRDFVGASKGLQVSEQPLKVAFTRPS